jgi:hypothetical protein
MGAILASFGPGAAFTRNIDISHHVAFVHGFSTALKVNAAIALFAAVLALFTMGRGGSTSESRSSSPVAKVES